MVANKIVRLTEMLLVVSIYCSVLVSFCGAWIIDVDSHTDACFFERAKKGVKIGLTFQVTDGGFLDIDLTIQGPDDQTLYTGQRESTGKFNFAAYKEGKYTFCFGNKMSTVAIKRVMFDVLVGREDEWRAAAVTNHSSEAEGVADMHTYGKGSIVKSSQSKDYSSVDWRINQLPSLANETVRLQDMVGSLSAELEGVRHEQEYLLALNLVHLRFSENTHAVVARWVLFEMIVIFAGTAFQVWYIQRFFEVKRVL